MSEIPYIKVYRARLIHQVGYWLLALIKDFKAQAHIGKLCKKEL
jgi:hypothetical protein